MGMGHGDLWAFTHSGRVGFMSRIVLHTGHTQGNVVVNYQGSLSALWHGGGGHPGRLELEIVIGVQT